MKRKVSLISLITLALLALFSCTKQEAEQEVEYYNEAQKQVFAMMYGTFKYDIMGVTTTISFGQHYDKPIEATYKKDGSTRELHGEMTITYWNGVSYTRYYRLSSDTKTFTMYDDNQNIALAYVMDFQYVDANTFKWKEIQAVLWDTYKRK